MPQHTSLWDTHAFFILDNFHTLLAEPQWHDWLVRIMETGKERGTMIFSCLHKPSSLKNCTETLRSRLEAGLLLELKEPDLDVRMRFSLQWCQKKNIFLHKEQHLFLAQRCASFRQLQGMLIKISAFMMTSRREPELTDLENIVSASSDRQLSYANIITTIADHYQIPMEDFASQKRYPQLVLARQTAMFLCRELLGLPYITLGKIFGGKDHSTVMHSIKKIKKIMDSDKDMNTTISILRKKCSQ